MIEHETEREPNTVRLSGYQYHRVTIKGELNLVNHDDETVQVEVTKQLSGNVLETTGEPEVTAVAKGLKAVNTNHVLVWKVDLPAGEEKVLTYRYNVLVR